MVDCICIISLNGLFYSCCQEEGLLLFLIDFLILGFYPCKPPGVTESEMGGHMNFVKLNKWKWKWKLHGT